MAYKQIYNNGPGAPSDYHISITPRGITFLKRAREAFKITKDVGIFVNEEGFLCFKFYEPDNFPKGCFKVNAQGGENPTPVIILSTRTLDAIGGKVGQYYAEEKDGYIVTNCKVAPEK